MSEALLIALMTKLCGVGGNSGASADVAGIVDAIKALQTKSSKNETDISALTGRLGTLEKQVIYVNQNGEFYVETEDE